MTDKLGAIALTFNKNENEILLSLKDEIDVDFISEFSPERIKNILQKKNYKLFLLDYDLIQTNEKDIGTLKSLLPEDMILILLVRKSLRMEKVISAMKEGVDDIVLFKDLRELTTKTKSNPKSFSLIKEKQKTSFKFEKNGLYIYRDFDNAIFESIKLYPVDSMFFKNKECEFVFINDRLVEFFQERSIYNVIGKKDNQVFCCEYVTQALEEDRKILAGELSTISNEKKLTWEGKPDTWVFMTKVSVRNRMGEIIGLFGVFRDITKFKNIFNELNEERFLLDSLMKYSIDNIYFKDRQSRFLKVNEKMKQHCEKIDIHDLIGKTDADIFETEHSYRAFEDEQKIMDTGIPMINYEEKEVWKDGTTNWISSTKIPIADSTGKIIGMFGISRDITSIKMNEVALTANEERLNSLYMLNQIESLPDYEIIQITMEEILHLTKSKYAGVILFIEEYEELFLNQRYSQETAFDDILREKLHSHINCFKDIKEPKVYEFSDDTKSENPFPVKRQIVTPITHEGTVLGICFIADKESNYNNYDVMVLDLLSEEMWKIISKKRVEKEVLKLSTTVEQSPVSIIICDIMGMIEYVNPRFLQETGYRPDEVISRNIRFILSPNMNDETFDELWETVNEGNNWSSELLSTKKDKEQFWENVTVSPIKNNYGEITNFVATKDNINEHKIALQLLSKEQEELKSILNTIADSVIIISTDDNISKVNHVFEKLFGLSEKEVKGLNITDLFERIELEEIDHENVSDLKSIAERLRGGAIDSIQKFKVIGKNGSNKIITFNNSSIKNNENQLEGYIIVITDLTEIITMEKQLSLSQKLESIGELAAGIAHEINTPLQYVGDNLRFLQDTFDVMISGLIQKENNEINHESVKDTDNVRIHGEDLDFIMDEVPRAIEQSIVGVERMSKIVVAMKDFAHPGIFRKSLSDINHGIEVTINISRNKWKYVAEIETDLQKNLPLVNCMTDEINQVILNMIINAAHAIEEKLGENSGEKGKIIISTSSDDKYVFIKISDSGAGIPQKNIARIFDPFFTTKEVGKGTGQGLAISHDIIAKKHGGQIKVASQTGVGTTFTIILPIIMDK